MYKGLQVFNMCLCVVFAEYFHINTPRHTTNPRKTKCLVQIPRRKKVGDHSAGRSTVQYDFYLSIPMSDICLAVVADIRYLPILLSTFKVNSKKST